jgi:hypothetical protein
MSKLSPKEYNFDLCWCGCDRNFHLVYVPYTGYACMNCDRCNDFELPDLTKEI